MDAVFRALADPTRRQLLDSLHARNGQALNALCEQMEAPGRGKKLLRREVVRVITPGTITDTAYLASAANNFLLAVIRAREG